jgi:hypothetical protein
MDEGRKRVLLIAASILAARKLVNWDGRLSPGTGVRHCRCNRDCEADHGED